MPQPAWYRGFGCATICLLLTASFASAQGFYQKSAPVEDAGIATYQPSPPAALPAPVPPPSSQSAKPVSPFGLGNGAIDADEVAAQTRLDAATAAAEAGQPAPAATPSLYAPYPAAANPGDPASQATPSAPLPLANDSTAAPAPAPAAAHASTDGIVQLIVLNKTVAQSKTVEVPTGTILQYGALEIRPERCWIDPGARPVPAQAVLIDITEHKESSPPAALFSGWMLVGDPSISHLEHPYYDVNVIGCRAKDAPTPESGVAEKDGKAKSTISPADSVLEDAASATETED